LRLRVHDLLDDVEQIVDSNSERAIGVAAYARIDRASGIIEVGGINYSPRLQRRPGATEAMYLMMRRVFDELGYRRYEWKCDALNGRHPGHHAYGLVCCAEPLVSLVESPVKPSIFDPKSLDFRDLNTAAGVPLRSCRRARSRCRHASIAATSAGHSHAGAVWISTS
jgi:hypothetical protein